MRYRVRKLSTQIFLVQLVILTASMAVGFGLFANAERAHLDHHYEAQAAAIAQTVAGVPTVRSCMASQGPGCAQLLQDFATTTEHQTGASYVVIIDMNRVRHTHPDPTLVGQKVAEPIVTRDGKVHLTIDKGKTGHSANAKAPLYGPAGEMVGEVSVGLRESSVTTALWRELPSYGVWFVVALGIGALASWGLATRLKHRTFGLELDEIARLLQEREATLHGIREGVVAVDESGRISVVNDEAQRLLRLPVTAARRQLEDVLPEGTLRDVLAGRDASENGIVFTDDHCLVVNRMPVTLNGRPHGTVVTLRDRTEMEGLLRELHGERSLTESLRAQQHEFSNRMHALAGMLELGRSEDALSYVTEIRGTSAEFDQTLRLHISAPAIVGLLLGKAAEASERGIELRIEPSTHLTAAPHRVHALTTILGNLIDNAFDALTGQAAPRLVTVKIVEGETGVLIEVSDNGPGIPAGSKSLIFGNEYSTKHGAARRGLGLALVHQQVLKLHGTVTVSDGPGATFVVNLPAAPNLVSSGSSGNER